MKRFNSRHWILITVMIGTFMGALDSSIVNVSVPAMMRSLGADLSQVKWVIMAYMIGFGVSMPLTNWLKDRWGYAHLYSSSLILFTLGSLLCGVAPSLSTLVWARIIQALGGGALTPTAMAIVSRAYPPSDRGRALGMWGLGVVIGPAIGPTLGGILTELFSWRVIFLINLPVGILGVWMARRFLAGLPRDPVQRRPFDFLGFLLISGSTVAGLYGLSLLEFSQKGEGRPQVWIVASLISLGAFVWSSMRARDPLLDLRVLRSKTLVACLIVTFVRAGALYGGIFLLPFLLQQRMGLTETQSGLLMLPGALLLAASMPLSGRVADRYGTRLVSILGLLLASASMLGIAYFGGAASKENIFWLLVLRGLGIGLLVTPISAATVSAVQTSEMATASTYSGIMQQMGGAAGIASLACIYHRVWAASLARGMAGEMADNHALRVAFLCSGVLVCLALIPAFFLPRHALEESSGSSPLT